MTTPGTPGGAGRSRSGEELLEAARRREAQIRRRGRVAAGAVAACGVGGIAAALLVFVPGQTKQTIEVAGSPSGPNQTAQRVIPWTDAPARPPAATPTPTPPPPSYSACSAGQVRASAGRVGAATGNVAVGILLTNVGTTPCSLSGYPTSLDGVFPGGALQVLHPMHGTMFDAASAWPANLHPGAVARLTLGTSDVCYGATPPTPYTAAIIGLPGGGRVTAPVTFSAVCGVDVSTFGEPAPSQAATGSYPGLTAATSLTAAGGATPVAAGTTLQYSVTLTNNSANTITFRSCPVYEESIYSGGSPSVAYYRLNCAPARTIPSGGQVTYAMQIQVPAATGVAKFGWNIPNSAAAYSGGVLTITKTANAGGQ